MNQPLSPATVNAVDALCAVLKQRRAAHVEMIDIDLGKYLTINAYYTLIGRTWHATETSPGEIPVPHITKLEIRVGDWTREVQIADLPRDLQEYIDNAILDHEQSR